MNHSLTNEEFFGGVSDFAKSVPRLDSGEIDYTALTHPNYDSMLMKWQKYRIAFQGGREFVDKYLVKFSKRETNEDFAERKKLTYIPGHARTAVLEIRNAIFQRMSDITRNGGTKSYQRAVNGELGGVDGRGTSMNSFMGTSILTDLMIMTRVGVFVDKAILPENATLSDSQMHTPYMYKYSAEDIRSWGYGEDGDLSTVLLRDHDYYTDPESGLITGLVSNFRLLTRFDDHVLVRFIDSAGSTTNLTELQMDRIPFAIAEIADSILTDVVDHQIALLNLASGDMSYATKSNFPFYIEQYDPQAEMLANLHGQATNAGGEGTTADGNSAASKQVTVGVSTGRGYSKGLEKPGFIHPSSEPLRVSMEKQTEIKKEIRELVSLSVTTLGDGQGLEAGLAYLGLALEGMERRLGLIWNLYEGGSEDYPIVTYPRSYSIRTDEDRLVSAETLLSIIPKVSSLTYQKELMKQAITITVGHRLPADEVGVMHQEVEDSPFVVIDPEVLDIDLENGLVDSETASRARLYPKDAHKKAKEERIEKALAVTLAQTAQPNVNALNGGARGVKDVAIDPEKDAKQEKDISQRMKSEVDGVDRTRGKGKPRPRKKK